VARALDSPDPSTAARGADARPLVELSSRDLAAGVVSASDESFGNKEHLLTVTPAVFAPGTYDHRGEVVDGWETRRRREPGYDWAVVRLGLPGVIRRVDVDTSFFTGNHPEHCWVEACGLEGYPSPAELDAATWVRIAARRALQGDAHNLIDVEDDRRFTHLRLCIEPDGGVARLRAFGDPVVDPRLLDGVTLDLASQQIGGQVVRSSDSFYGSAMALNRPDRARTMGEGWETRRRRDGGNDWVLIRLAAAGTLQQVEIDTMHFKHNASSHARVSATGSAHVPDSDDDAAWTTVLDLVRLQPDTRHVYRIQGAGPVTYVRVDALPDGGISRIRVLGSPTPQGRLALGLRWLNTLPDDQTLTVLSTTGLPDHAARALLSRRPFRTLDAALRTSEEPPAAGSARRSGVASAALRMLIAGPDAATPG
jgi:allantoicase